MRILRVFLLLITACLPGSALRAQQPPPLPAAVQAEVQALYLQALEAYEAGDIDSSIVLGLASIERGARRGTVPLHRACCYARIGDPDEAFRYLHLGFERGWRDLERVRSEPAFRALHDDARWATALAAGQAAFDAHLATLPEPDIARELLARRERDQRLRRGLDRLLRSAPGGHGSVPMDSLPPDLRGDVDGENTAYLKTVVDAHGWPGRSLVGEEAAAAAWLLVQHADADPDFQERCLALVEAAFAAGEMTGYQVAYLTDRVRLARGRKQL